MFSYVDIIAGLSKISLDDLKNLDIEEILVLETSDIKKMTLKSPTITHEFKVNPEPYLMIDTSKDEEGDETEFENEKGDYMLDNKSMWDDIQIEVSAEFKRVKMTLGELKQISKGLVIDLGPIMNNEISLLVENKTVAKGELVIINDKYGVKITEVYAKKKEEKETAQEQTKAPEPPAHNPSSSAQQNPQTPPQKPIPQRPSAPNRPAPAPRPQGAQRPAPKPAPAPRPQDAPNKPHNQAAPQAQSENKGNKEDFDYSNFEE